MDKSDIKVSAVVFILSLLVSVPIIFYSPNVFDEGLIYYGAERIADGHMPYEDGLTYYAPGHLYGMALAFSLFGYSINVGRAYFAVLNAVMAVAAYLICRKLGIPKRFSVLSSIIFIFLVQRYLYISVSRVLFGAVSMLFALHYGSRLDRKWLWLTGIALGLSLICSQEIGAFALISVLVYMFFVWRGQKKKIIAGNYLLLIAGVAVIVVPTLLFFLANGVINGLIYSLFWFPVTRFALYNRLPFPNIFESQGALDVLRASLFYYVIILYMIGIAYAALAMRRGAKDGFTRGLLLMSLFGILSYYQATVRADTFHLMFVIFPALVVQSCLLHELYAAKCKLKLLRILKIAIVMAIPASLIIYGAYTNTYSISSNYFSKNYNWWSGDRAIFLYKTEKVEQINEIINIVKNNTVNGDYIFTFPHPSLFYFLTDRDNPTGFNHLVVGDSTPEQQLKIIEQLSEKMPKIMIHGKDWDQYGSAFSDYAKPVFDYIVQNYYLYKTIGPYDIYMINAA